MVNTLNTVATKFDKGNINKLEELSAVCEI